jgi:hypothetical protein
VALVVGLLLERGAVLVLVAVVSGFASIVLLGSGLLRRFLETRTPPS